MRTISFSEIDTFLSCRRKHFFRYKLRLQSKRYNEMRALIIGSITHGIIERLYQDKPENPSDQWILDAATEEMAAKINEFWSGGLDKSVYHEDFEIAFALGKLWRDKVYLAKDFELLGFEVPFKTKASFGSVIGFKDQRYRHDDKIYVGEVKTRGPSFSSKLETVLKKDLQTEIYLWSEMKENPGAEVGGVVYTILKKPKLPDNLAPEDLRSFLTEYYKTGNHLRRKAVAKTVDPKAVEAELEKIVHDIDVFYEDPYTNAAEVEVGPSYAMPCRFCEFASYCHQGMPFDRDFSIKGGRKIPNK